MGDRSGIARVVGSCFFFRLSHRARGDYNRGCAMPFDVLGGDLVVKGTQQEPRLNILARSCQDPAKILVRSCQDLAKILHDLAGFKILPRSWQDLG